MCSLSWQHCCVLLCVSLGTRKVAREKLRSGAPAGISVLRTCAAFVRSHRAESEFPFLARVDRICAGKAAPESLTEMAVPRVRASKALKAGAEHREHSGFKDMKALSCDAAGGCAGLRKLGLCHRKDHSAKRAAAHRIPEGCGHVGA